MAAIEKYIFNLSNPWVLVWNIKTSWCGTSKQLLDKKSNKQLLDKKSNNHISALVKLGIENREHGCSDAK